MIDREKVGRKVLNAIYLKAWADTGFKRKLLQNPESTLEDFFGKKLPSDKKIVVADQSDPDSIYINIPVKPNLNNRDNAELKLSLEKLKNRSYEN